MISRTLQKLHQGFIGSNFMGSTKYFQQGMPREEARARCHFLMSEAVSPLQKYIRQEKACHLLSGRKQLLG